MPYINSFISFFLTRSVSALLFSLCIWHMDQEKFSSVCWVSGPVVPSVHVSRLSVVCAREMQKCEREMQQLSSCFIPRSVALLMECFSELLLHVSFFFSQPALMWRILSCLLAHSRIHTHTPDRRRTLVPWMIWEAWFLCQSLDSRPSCALQSGIYNQTPVNLIYFNKSMLVLLQTHQIMCTQTYIQDVHIFPIIRGYFLSRSLYLLVMNSHAFLHVVNNQIKF